MTRAEAKRRVCWAAAMRLHEDQTQPDYGDGLDSDDLARLDDATDDLIAELTRRAGGSDPVTRLDWPKGES